MRLFTAPLAPLAALSFTVAAPPSAANATTVTVDIQTFANEFFINSNGTRVFPDLGVVSNPYLNQVETSINPGNLSNTWRSRIAMACPPPLPQGLVAARTGFSGV